MKKKVYRELHKNDEEVLSIDVAEPISFEVDEIVEKKKNVVKNEKKSQKNKKRVEKND